MSKVVDIKSRLRMKVAQMPLEKGLEVSVAYASIEARKRGRARLEVAKAEKRMRRAAELADMAHADGVTLEEFMLAYVKRETTCR